MSEIRHWTEERARRESENRRAAALMAAADRNLRIALVISLVALVVQLYA
jgi:hypothetical protein